MGARRRADVASAGAHDVLARTAVESHRGTVVKMTGDGMHAAFDDALDALAATVDLQQALADPIGDQRCRAARALRAARGGGRAPRQRLFGSPVNRAARIMSAAHGGQVLLSQAMVDRVRDVLPAAVSLRDLGQGPAQGPVDPRTRLSSRAPAICGRSFRRCARWRPRRTTCRSRLRASSGARRSWRS